MGAPELTELLLFTIMRGQKSSRRLLCTFFLTAISVTSFAQGRLISIDTTRLISEINMTTGSRTTLGTLSTLVMPGGLAYDKVSQKIYMSTSSDRSLYTLDLTTLTATLIGSFGVAVNFNGLEWDSVHGVLYGASSHNGALYTINTTTGAATQITSSPTQMALNLGYNSLTDTMYATNNANKGWYSVNRTTGAFSLIGTLGTGLGIINGLAFNSDNGIMYMVEDTTSDGLYSVNMATGAATLIGRSVELAAQPAGCGRLGDEHRV